MPPPTRDQVFISYSHEDKEWLEKLQTMLKPLCAGVPSRVGTTQQIQARARNGRTKFEAH